VRTKLIDALRQVALALGDVLPHRLFVAQRRALYRLAGVRIGARACVYGRQVVLYPERLEIGDDCFVNVGCTFENEGGVRIGAGTYVGPGVQFLTTNHRGPGFRNETAAIEVGERVWIGGGAIVLPGARLGEGVVVGAGAVVRGSLAQPGLYVGVPARPANAPERGENDA